MSLLEYILNEFLNNKITEHRMLSELGLHTCGNLASTSAKLFVHSPLSSFFCNVGCCYHLLDELDNANGEPGFPLSQQLKELGYALGRNARMVSSQPLERYASEKKVPLNYFYKWKIYAE